MATRSVNEVRLLGHLGRDAETSSTPAGASVTKFSLATSRRWKDQSGEWKEEIDWAKIVLWRQEALAPYLTKGKQIYVQGRLQTLSHDKDGAKVFVTEVIAEEVILLGGSEGGSDQSRAVQPPVSAPRAAGRPAAVAKQQDPFGGMGVTLDDVPI